MLRELSLQQIHALNRYEELQAERPGLFRLRHLRPLVLKRPAMEAYAKDRGVVLGVAAETPYFLFLVDLVQPAAGGDPFAYSRLVNVGQMKGGVNVAVLAVVDAPALGNLGDIVLVEQERHATGMVETAIPRGFGEPGQPGAVAALRELEEETGYRGSEVVLMGESVIDSGSGDARVSFYRVMVHALAGARPERTEAIRTVRLLSPAALWRAVQDRKVTDSFTLQALALGGYRQPDPERPSSSL